MQRKNSGFTLIELLIVVAIIAILAAIAVPNFLEAQTRAKVSRVHADFRSVATAIEAFAVDNRHYPYSHNNQNQGPGWLEPPTRRLRALTTPIAYMSKVPGPSPFVPAIEDGFWGNEFQYSTNEGVQAINDTVYLNGYYRLCAVLPPVAPNTQPVFTEGPAWMILDRGPDGLYMFHWQWTYGWPWEDTMRFYDPTNGTVSAGEIIRSQLKSSFSH
jgi:type II secretion system protein G